ncbi:MAG: SpoIIIAH-like family protein [Clostridium sp.]|uniref:SpoIIIAH-like family protein n=1 Tax=Clostridium sp. TaxID=1506 RepID=UPI002FCBAF34
MPNFKKQTVIIAVLIGLIGCASFFAKEFNDSFKDTDMVLKPETEITETLGMKKETTKNFFAEGRMARENQRTTMKQELESIINNKNATKESKEKATRKLMSIIEKGEKETKIETMVKEKGFEEALCIIDDNGVEICVKSQDKLNGERVNQIKDIAVRASGVAPTGIIVKQNQ